MSSVPAQNSGSPAPVGFTRTNANLATGTLVSRILGLVSAFVLAHTLGTLTAASNTFTIANQLPNNVYAIIAGGLLSAILVPQIVRAGRDPDGGDLFVNRVVTFGAVIFVVVTLIATLCAPLLVHLYAAQQTAGSSRGMSPGDLELATAFAYWCLPQIFFYAMYSMLGEILNARKVYGPFSWAPVVNNVVAIIGLVAFDVIFRSIDIRQSDHWTPTMIAVIAGTATLGVVGQAGFLVLFWKRTGLTYRPNFHWRGVGLGRVGKTAGWTFAMILITQLAGVVQSSVASLAGSNNASNTVLRYAWLIFMLPHGIITLPIMTPYFTRMAGHAHRNDLASLREDIATSLRSVGVLMCFAGISLIVLAFQFSAVFSTGASATRSMALVLIAYLIDLIPASILFVLQRTFYALEDTRTPFLFQTFQSILFVSGAVVVSEFPRGSIALGIAALTSAAGIAQTFLAAWLLRRRIGNLGTIRVGRAYLVFLLALLPATAAGVALDIALGAFSGGFATAGAGPAIASIALIGIVMAVIYIGMLRLLRSPELTAIAAPLVRRLRARHDG